jgi:tRNA(Arg) A34 adenosine deaminase TadA
MTAKLADATAGGKAAKPMAMALALAEAETARDLGEVPIGAGVVGAEGEVLAAAGQPHARTANPTAHAEACSPSARRAPGRQRAAHRLRPLLSALEPCAMCAAAISFARIRRLYFGASDPKGGAVEHGPRFYAQPTCHHAPEAIGGISGARAAALLKDFFAARR